MTEIERGYHVYNAEDAERRMTRRYEEAQLNKANKHIAESPDTVDNPYWEIVKQLPDEPLTWRSPDEFTPEAYPTRLIKQDPKEFNKIYERQGRSALVERYAWAIPNPDTLQFIVDVLNGRPVVELGAGTGYWAWMLTQMGVDVLAFDKHPPHEGRNHYHCPKEEVEHVYTAKDRKMHKERRDAVRTLTEGLAQTFRDSDTKIPGYLQRSLDEPEPELPDTGIVKRPRGPGLEYHAVRRGGVKSLALPEVEGRALFLCWPPYNSPFGYTAIKAYRGDMIILIGEGEGGCTGDDKMYQLLDTEWKLVAEQFNGFTRWSGLNDYVAVYTRRDTPS